MEIQIYSCSAKFPGHIERVLQENGFVVEPLTELHAYTNTVHGAFSFRIRKRQGELKVVGSENGDEYRFHMVEGNDLDSHAQQVTDEMYDDVERLMLTHGADLYDIEEL